MEEKYYVIQNFNGKFFSYDNYTGGYPCFSKYFDTAERFETKEKAQEFMESEYCTRMFKREFTNAIIKSVTVIIVLGD